ncbi:PASTA domain-containing protein [Sphingobacteriaceae bacterium AH-315-L07]|nr:PASTA domain-containing protein [Bacteroidia bacterium]MBN4052442.1 PASTA domain-containing protein [Sphingobacteriaceae bacterium AH-315-L07]
MLKFLISKSFLINFTIAVLVVGLGLYIALLFLDNFTHHGESLTVPDVRKMTVAEAEEFLTKSDLRVKILDSNYTVGHMPRTVVDQDPSPDTKVKPNRSIYIIINTSSPPKLKMPELKDVTLRQAESIISSKGLKLGEIIYRPDLAKNVVLEQHYKGKVIKPGTMILKGAEIELVIGDGLGTTKVSVPRLIGMSIDEAKKYLHKYFLNIGAIISEGEVTDTNTAKVFRQFPMFGKKEKLIQGETVDIFIKQ